MILRDTLALNLDGGKHVAESERCRPVTYPPPPTPNTVSNSDNINPTHCAYLHMISFVFHKESSIVLCCITTLRYNYFFL